MIPIIFGSLTVFSFEPFNLTIINFLIFPFFYFLLYINKKSRSDLPKKNLIKKIYFYLDCHLDLGFT